MLLLSGWTPQRKTTATPGAGGSKPLRGALQKAGIQALKACQKQQKCSMLEYDFHIKPSKVVVFCAKISHDSCYYMQVELASDGKGRLA